MLQAINGYKKEKESLVTHVKVKMIFHFGFMKENCFIVLWEFIKMNEFCFVSTAF